jgi:crossover junction endodeoxyribonuclease RuvC
VRKDLSDDEFQTLKAQVKRAQRSGLPQYKKDQYYEAYEFIREEGDAMRVLAFDTSMGAPGIAVSRYKKGKPSIIKTSATFRTDSRQPHGLRYAEIVEAWATLFIAKHVSKGFSAIARGFRGQNVEDRHPVYSAWGSCDKALNKFGLNFTTPAISQSAVKKAVVGVGKAEKHEVETAVRKWTGYAGEFAKDDESDAAAIALAYLIREGLIKK